MYKLGWRTEEQEEQHQHEFQFPKEDLTQYEQVDTLQDEIQQHHVNQEHPQHKHRQHQTQEWQLTSSEELLQQLHQKVNISNKSCKSYNSETLAITSHNHFNTGMLMLVVFLMKKETF